MLPSRFYSRPGLPVDKHCSVPLKQLASLLTVKNSRLYFWTYCTFTVSTMRIKRIRNVDVTTVFVHIPARPSDLFSLLDTSY